MVSCCLRSRVVGGDLVLEGPQLPFISSSRVVESSKELNKHFSTLEQPTVVPFDTALVNLDCLASTGVIENRKRRNFVRLQSMRPPRGLEWTESRRVLEHNIRLEQEGDRRGGLGSADLRSQEQRLRDRLDRLQLDMYTALGDGNCQFRAISEQLYGSEAFHQSIRTAAVQHIRSWKAEYEGFLGEDYETYLKGMAREYTWGDELTLRAVCDCFGVVINVVTSESTNWYLKYEPPEVKVPQEVFLTYISPVHYNSLRRRSSLRKLQRALSNSFGRQSHSSTSSVGPSDSSSSDFSGFCQVAPEDDHSRLRSPINVRKDMS